MHSNDILVSEGGEVGRTAIWKNELSECYIQNSVHKITINSNNNPHYYLYHFQVYGKTGYFDSIVHKVSIAHLTREKLKDIRFLSPLSIEQQPISNYLDQKTNQIDTLIQKKQKQVDLLKEYRTAIINDAVTKGLNPNVKMKNSGIEWLGEIPEHWEVKKLKYVCTIKGRIGFRGYTTEDLVDKGEGAITLGATHITEDGKIDLSCPVYISWEKYYESPEIMITKGDIAIVQRGSTCGKVGLIEDNIGSATINPSLVLLKASKNYSKYSFYFIKGNFLIHVIGNLLSSTAIPMLSQEQIGNSLILNPPYEEQIEIVNFIEFKTTKIDQNISIIVKQLQLLQEYRTSLISEVITGKIDIRDKVQVPSCVPNPI